MSFVNYRHVQYRFPATALMRAAVLLLSIAVPCRAQSAQQGSQQTPPPTPPPASSTSTPPQGSSGTQTTGATPTPTPTPTPAPDGKPDQGNDKNRIFGVLPNYTSVEGATTVKPITTGASFKMAALDSFDPMVYPLFGFIAGVSHIQNDPPSYGRTWDGYVKRYGLAFADNSVCSIMTTGVFPSVFHQDPRYYQGHATGFFKRAGYAASRSLVTKSRSGHPQFNISEVGGTLVVANVGNLYYPEEERNAISTLERWGTQAMWDTFSNELKEFWPDIRKMMHSW
jgi:hypothetical protein